MKQNMIDTYREIHRLRSLHEDTFPTPSARHSWLFAVTEVGEAADAELREHPLYKRNNDRTVDLYAELADVTLMLFTAIQDEDNFGLNTIETDGNGVKPLTHEEMLLELSYRCGLGCSYIRMERTAFADLSAIEALSIIYSMDPQCGEKAIQKLIATQEKFAK